ncbi:MAG: aminotransferase class V-fold PLP-dependent enzyme [Anaerolineae bacterium]|nr:aminotransferase class V-fold PLP-dependent enzyme [Anaerolineae bacterium]
MISNTGITPSLSVDVRGYDIDALRQGEFPLTATTAYLTHASISPLPQRTLRAMQEMNERVAASPLDAVEWYNEQEKQFLQLVKAYINAAEIEEVIGMTSTSLGFNLIAQAIQWQRGDSICLCDIEFPSNVYPWLRLQEQYGVEVRLIPAVDGGLTLEALDQYVDASTRMVCASATQFFSGQRTDLSAIGAYCHERGIIFTVDAIQAAGHMPLDVQAMHIDILCAGGLKSLLGPSGQGFMYVRRDLVERMYPTIVGPNAVEDYLHWLWYDMKPLPGAARFIMGTVNSVGVVGLSASMSLLRELGLANIDRHCSALVDYLMDQLSERGYAIVTPRHAHCNIVTFRAAPTTAATDQLVAELRRRGVFVIRHWDKQEVAHIRVSTHCYNTRQDVDRLLAGLKEIAV